MCLKLTTSLKIKRRPGITATQVDNELVMMDLAQNKYYGLNTVGAFIWSKIEEPISIEKLCDLAVAEFDISQQECESEILVFANRMHKALLIEAID